MTKITDIHHIKLVAIQDDLQSSITKPISNVLCETFQLQCPFA